MTAPFGLLSFPREVTWTPASLGSGLALWLRGDLGLTMGTGVATWADQSGNGRNVTQATGSKQPTTGTAINSKATLHFDPTAQQFMSRATALSLTAAHVFIVCKLVSDPTTGADFGFWQFGSEGNVALPYTDGTLYDSFGSTTRPARGTSGGAMSAAGGCVYEAITTATEWTNLLNGSQKSTTATNTVGWEGAGFIVGGSAATGSIAATGFIKGDIAEIILADHKLTTERTDVAAYILARYALTI